MEFRPFRRPLVLAAALAWSWPAAAQSVNTDQLLRVLAGETIPEAPPEEGERPFTEEFHLADRDFAPNGRNRFFSLEPCFQLRLAGDDQGELVELSITVLGRTRDITLDIGGRPQVVRTRVVEERESVDGELREVSLNYYARDRRTGDIFYFGEDVCFYRNGRCVGTEGSWLAGVDGAVPGVIMPGSYFIGARYFQEQAPGVAMDRARHGRMDLGVTVPAGEFKGCAVVLEDTPLEPGSVSRKVYAPGVGLARDGVLELVWHGFIPGCGG